MPFVLTFRPQSRIRKGVSHQNPLIDLQLRRWFQVSRNRERNCSQHDLTKMILLLRMVGAQLDIVLYKLTMSLSGTRGHSIIGIGKYHLSLAIKSWNSHFISLGNSHRSQVITYLNHLRIKTLLNHKIST